MQIRKNHELALAFQEAEYVFNDGVGVDFAALIWQGSVMPANLNGTDWISAFLSVLVNSPYYKDANTNQVHIFLITANSEVQDGMQKIFAERWPTLMICGIADGYTEDESAIISQIQKSSPQIVIVGMGSPQQELFITRNWAVLQQSNVMLAIAAGAFFDFLTKKVRRAPQWMQKIRFEWLYRWLQEPRRLTYRYFVEGVSFVFNVVLDRLKALLQVNTNIV